MILKLSIQNYAIIQNLEVDFHPQLNIITGETGAGKSILLGALNLILGKRADSTALYDTTKKCIVEGIFAIDKSTLKPFFEDHDLDFEDETIIRREIKANGKSRAFINDTPVNLDTLKKLTTQLVDLHEQQETQTLLENSFYLNILDHLAKQTNEVSAFKSDFVEYSKKKKKLEKLQNEIIQLQSNKDYLEFQLNELLDLNLTEEDDQSLEEELNVLENAELIQETISDAINLLEGENQLNLIDLYSEFASKIGKIGQFNKELEAIQARAESISIELDDINHEMNRISSDLSVDDERLSFLKDRQSDINRLLQKHNLSDIKGLINLQSSLNQQLDSIEFGTQDVGKLEVEVQTLKSNLFKQAKAISTQRKQQITPLKQSIEKVLQNVGMPYATVILNQSLKGIEEMKSNGIDTFNLLFSANKGSEPQSLKKVASGGERSRLKLAIKSTVSEKIVLPTMIFDEIDTGISGEVATKVGTIFKSLSQNHQIIAITHLPQIAAKANQHLFVYKDHTGKKTNTGIKVLDPQNQVLEIAKMLSGDNPSNASISAAKELVKS